MAQPVNTDKYDKWEKRLLRLLLYFLGFSIIVFQAFSSNFNWAVMMTGLFLVGAVPAWRLNDYIKGITIQRERDNET